VLAVDAFDRELRLFGVWCARQVLYLFDDDYSIEALKAAEGCARWQASHRELARAQDDVSLSSRDAARGAAWCVTMIHACDAAWRTARTAV